MTRQKPPRRPWRSLAATLSVLGVAAAISAIPVLTGDRSPASAATWETLIDGTSFANREALVREWNFNYPWGTDHNGTARMVSSATDSSHVYLPSSGVLTIKATRLSSSPGNSTKDPYLPIHYYSGAIHAKDQIIINDTYPNYEVRGEFQAPSASGTWPAFWLTGTNSWPPESDILEYKGDTRNWFNTYTGSWQSKTVNVSSPGSWHEYRVWMTKTNATDVSIHYYLDGQWQAVHNATNFVGKSMWLIINLQMEGSSGSSGPSGDTFYSARNVYVGRSHN